MDIAQFHVPVRIVPRPGADAVEIHNADEALGLLIHTPIRKGSAAENTLAACLLACAFPSEMEDARSSFVRFARRAKILAKDQPAKRKRRSRPAKASRG